MLEDITEPIASFTGDNGYDQNSVYRAVLRKSKDSKRVNHPRDRVSENGHKETNMFRIFLMMGFILGEGYLGTINKVKWRTQSIDTKQSLKGDYEQELNREEKLKLLLDPIS